MTKDYLERQFKNYHSVTGGVVTPQMFGAVADGVHDDTEALVTAIESGGMVYLPKGTYKIHAKAVVHLTADTTIFGDGERESVIVPYYDGVQTGEWRKHFLSIYGESYALTIKSIGMIYDPVDKTNMPNSMDLVLLYLFETFKSVSISNIYLHANNQTQHTLMWMKCAAENITIRDSLFENFSGEELGGCIWIMSGQDLGHNPPIGLHIGNILVTNNIFRNSNKDEALGIWSKSVEDSLIESVTVTNNEFVHKDWEGVSFPSANIMSLYSHATDGTNESREIVANNVIDVGQVNGHCVLKAVSVKNALFDGNQIRVRSVASGISEHELFHIKESEAKVCNNVIYFDSTAVIRLACQDAKGIFSNNFISSNGRIRLVNNTNMYSDMRLENNDIALNGEEKDIRFEGSTTDKSAKIVFNNNHVKGFLKLVALKDLVVSARNNIMTMAQKPSVTCAINDGSVEWLNNEGETIVFRDTSLTTKLDSFVYEGDKGDIMFVIDNVVTPDSDTVRNTFFTSSRITYTSEETSDIDFATELEVV